jgi:hypothetical protein
MNAFARSVLSASIVLGVVVGLSLLNSSSAVGAPGPSGTTPAPVASAPAQYDNARVPVFRPFTAVNGSSGAPINVASTSDCKAILNQFLQSWCTIVAGSGQIQLPTTGGNAQDNPRFFAAFARALLGNDDSICSMQAVDRWVRAMGHVADGSQTCHDSLAVLRAQGWFGVTDPATGQTLVIALK